MNIVSNILKTLGAENSVSTPRALEQIYRPKWFSVTQIKPLDYSVLEEISEKKVEVVEN